MKDTGFVDTLQSIQHIIAELTGNDLEEVHPDAILDEELNISLTEFTQIIRRINQQFELTLSTKDLHDEVETVQELATAVHDERELG
ncbi:acyl carrier protein [Candidatus Woesebacteria bacterium]|nr:acyl carrier protein [Candidatus Woesebacteria bacterium]